MKKALRYLERHILGQQDQYNENISLDSNLDVLDIDSKVATNCRCTVNTICYKDFKSFSY